MNYIKSLIRNDTEDSPTNFGFLVLLVFLILWETYAIFTKTLVPHIEVISSLLFMIKVTKAYADKTLTKSKSTSTVTTTPENTTTELLLEKNEETK